MAWPLQSESDPSEKKLFEHQKQKFRKLNEQLIDEKEKYSAAQREYYQLIQKSDKVRSYLVLKLVNSLISRAKDHEFKLYLKNKKIIANVSTSLCSRYISGDLMLPSSVPAPGKFNSSWG